MPQYDNNFKGALFKNEKKENDNHPDFKGTCQVAGVDFWLSAWAKTAKSGQKYISLSFQEKEKEAESQGPTKQQTFTQSAADDFF